MNSPVGGRLAVSEGGGAGRASFNEERMMKRRAMVIYSRGLIQSASRACEGADFMLASIGSLSSTMNLAF